MRRWRCLEMVAAGGGMMTPPADPVGGSAAKSDAAPADLAAEMRGRAVSLHSYITIHEASR